MYILRKSVQSLIKTDLFSTQKKIKSLDYKTFELLYTQFYTGSRTLNPCC